jgi:hypothetical protein
MIYYYGIGVKAVFKMLDFETSLSCKIPKSLLGFLGIEKNKNIGGHMENPPEVTGPVF